MRADLWQRVSELFEKAFDIDPSAREAWISEHCAGDAELESALRNLIAADDSANSQEFLDTPVPTADPDLIAANQKFGPYRLLRLLGQGGMGEVHLAERADGVFEQRVALKLVPHPTPGLIQRFVQERQILARMEHPNIARLLDGGIGEHGVPYFAMEYVEGMPISRYVAERQLDVVATLKLFLHVCDAVQYAHRNLVVHRDLKPSNIFVAADATPKLLDFGVAKVLSTTDVDPAHTATRVFTPDYAAPEQLMGLPVTTATDVYSLGVVLYELLTGVKPFSFNRKTAPDQATERMDVSAPSASRSASIDSQRRRQLRGDLDRIVLTMLAREPERRYGTVEAMSNDIRRFLGGLPIAARGDSASYRLRKFVRRNRIAIAASLLVATALVSATIVSARQAHRANLQAQRAETVKAFLVGVFNVVNPDENGGESISARKLLDNGVARVDSEMASQPALHAELTDMFGNLYFDIGDEKRAEELLKRAVELSEHLDDDPTLYPKSLTDLGQMERRRGDYANALAHDAAARDRANALGRKDLAIDARRELAESLEAKGDFPGAETELRAILTDDTALRGEADKEIGLDLHNLALLLDETDHRDEAAKLYERALGIARATHSQMSTAVATILNDYALLLQNNSDFAGAERMMRQALAIHIKVEGPDHPQTIESLNNLATILNGEGRFDESMVILQQALDARRRIYGSHHQTVAVSLNNIAMPEFSHGKFEDAERHLREAVAIWTETKGGDNPDTVRGLRNLAAVERAQEKFGDAEALGKQALAVDRRHYPEASEQVAASLTALGRTQKLEGKFDDAIANFNAALTDLRAAKLDTTSSETVLALQSIGETELMRNDPAAAKRALVDADVLSQKIFAADNHHRADVWIALGRTEHLLGNDAASEKLLRQSLALREPVYKPPSIWMAEVQVALAETLHAQHKRDEAASLAGDAAQSLRTMKTAVSRQMLARAEAVIAGT